MDKAILDTVHETAQLWKLNLVPFRVQFQSAKTKVAAKSESG